VLETKLIVGRYLQFTPAPSRPVTGNPPLFDPVVCPVQSIQESSRRDPGASYNPFRNVGGQRTSTVAAGANPAANKVHRNFKWLPWYEGDISETDLDHDVLTGPMSGCILVSYMRAGVATVGHVGTVTVTEHVPITINTNVKALWNGFAAANPADVVGGFNPVDIAIPAHPPSQPGDSVGQTWGLFTTNGNFYAVQVWVQAGSATDFRIAAVHLMPSMTLAQLQNI